MSEQTYRRESLQLEPERFQGGNPVADYGSNSAQADALAAHNRPLGPHDRDFWISSLLMTEASGEEGPAAARLQSMYLADVAKLSPDQRFYLTKIQERLPPKSPMEAKEQLETARTSRGLTEADREKITDARAQVDALDLKVIDDGSDPNLVQIQVTFDGTWNDREQMPVDTNPALLSEMMPNSIYEKGVGTDISTTLLGGAFAVGAFSRLTSAYDNLVKKMAEIRKNKPQAQFVLILNGFSRGAATARAFANVLDERGLPGRDGQNERPRIGAMVLFDTVNTSMSDSIFQQTIPSCVENVLHVTAANEGRKTFPVTSVHESLEHKDPRLTEISLPGAHSDIGGSYPNAYSGVSLGIAHDYLTRLGVKLDPLALGIVPDLDDPALRLHDSDWALTRLLKQKDQRREVKLAKRAAIPSNLPS